jgi:type IV pilus assembly protein PilM
MGLSLKKKSVSRTPVGLDIDGQYLAAAGVELGRLNKAASVDLDPGVVTDGEVRDAAALGEALKAFFAAHGLPKAVRLGVSNRQIVVRQIELPWLDDDEQRDAAVRFQAADAIAMPLDDAVFDYQVARRVEAVDGAARMQVVIVAARRSMIDGFVEAARSAGLKPEGIDLNAFALMRALGTDASEQTARVFCNVSTMVNLAIAVGDLCVFTRPLSASWSSQDEGVASTLADEIRLSIDSYMGQPDARGVSEVVLSGPGSSHEPLVEELGVLLRLPVTVAPPLGSLDTAAMPAGEDPHRYTVATGLALGEAA